MLHKWTFFAFDDGPLFFWEHRSTNMQPMLCRLNCFIWIHRTPGKIFRSILTTRWNRVCRIWYLRYHAIYFERRFHHLHRHCSIYGSCVARSRNTRKRFALPHSRVRYINRWEALRPASDIEITARELPSKTRTFYHHLATFRTTV